VPCLECLLGLHGCQFHVAFALLSLGGLYIYAGDKVASLGDILLDSSPGLSDLVVPVMFREIEDVIFKINTFVQLDEGMEVLAAVLVVLLGYDILYNGMPLL